ncbi:MAG: discoidin domain-containing protein [Oscillospiraceae bacterium]|nr:discoidin domain-containing protein [Oscillospiraceae bacterium]
MKFFQKCFCLLTAGCLAVPFAEAFLISAEAAETVSISPLSTYEINDGVFEGWGTSLCWWANRVGYSDSLAQQTADVFYGDNGLRLNIARFNIGGGDNPSHTHITRTDSNMPGYTVWNGQNASYDWNADYNQRNVLLRSVKACGDDMIVEMFSNSPPYYMTNSGCSSGGYNPNENNLKDDCYDDFAEYLAEVCLHYEKDWGVHIQSIDAMNEPYTNYWSANSPKQEGCHFDQGSSQSAVITELQKSLAKRGLGEIMISGTDETSIDTQISSYQKLSDDAKNAISRIDTHTYSGSKRSELKNTAVSAGKNLWMSEVDGGATAGTNAGEMGAALWLAGRITTDVNDLNASAWIMWQVIDNHISKTGYNGNQDKGMVDTQGGYWGVAVADHDNDTIILTKKYYAFGQYTRYIRPGMIMLNSSGSTVTAYDKDNKQLVIVAYNDKSDAKDMSFDLSGFSGVGDSAQVIRTSNSENWKTLADVPLSGDMLNVSLAPQSVTTFLISNCSGGTVPENEIALTSDMLSGTNSWKNMGSTDFYKVFDGRTDTYFDGVGNGWVQADLGQLYDIDAIGYCPRQGYEYRMADSMFQFSEDGTNWRNAYTISGEPSFAMHYLTKFSGGNCARYIRYAVPEGKPQNSYNQDDVYCCNIAEIKLYGEVSPIAKYEKLIPAETSGSNSWHNIADYDYTKAFDGNTGTWFDGVGQGWVMADFGKVFDLKTIRFCPRKGYEYRMADGIFEISLDGENWTKVYTVSGKPDFSIQQVSLNGENPARYIRYRVPEGKPSNPYNTDDVYCCNLSELEFYGLPAEQPVIRGDIDSDGKADTADLVLLQKFLLNKGHLPEDTSADLNADGIVNIYDFILLKKLLLNA